MVTCQILHQPDCQSYSYESSTDQSNKQTGSGTITSTVPGSGSGTGSDSVVLEALLVLENVVLPQEVLVQTLALRQVLDTPTSRDKQVDQEVK